MLPKELLQPVSAEANSVGLTLLRGQKAARRRERHRRALFTARRLLSRVFKGRLVEARPRRYITRNWFPRRSPPPLPSRPPRASSSSAGEFPGRLVSVLVPTSRVGMSAARARDRKFLKLEIDEQRFFLAFISRTT